MESRAFRIAMLHMSQTEGVSDNEAPSVDDIKGEKITLDQKKSTIDDAIDSYYSPVLNAYIRSYEDVGQLVVAALNVVSRFGDPETNIDSFEKRLGSFKVKILNAVGDTAHDSKGSLSEKYLKDPATVGMDAAELDSYIRADFGTMKRDSITKVKKVESYLSS